MSLPAKYIPGLGHDSDGRSHRRPNCDPLVRCVPEVGAGTLHLYRELPTGVLGAQNIRSAFDNFARGWRCYMAANY